MKKFLYSICIVVGCLCVTSCALFDPHYYDRHNGGYDGGHSSHHHSSGSHHHGR